MDDSKTSDLSTFSLAVDIWSIGAVTFQMVTGRLAFSEPGQLFNYVVHQSPFPIEDSLSIECTIFIRDTMAASPRKRPTSQEALSYAWLEKQDQIRAQDQTAAQERVASHQNFEVSPTSPPVPEASARWTTVSQTYTLPTQLPIRQDARSNTTHDDTARALSEAHAGQNATLIGTAVNTPPLPVDSLQDPSSQGPISRKGMIDVPLALTDLPIRPLSVLHNTKSVDPLPIPAPSPMRQDAGLSNTAAGTPSVNPAKNTQPASYFQRVQVLDLIYSIHSVTFSSDGHWIVLGKKRRNALIYVDTGQVGFQMLQEIETGAGAVNSTFSKSGRWMILFSNGYLDCALLFKVNLGLFKLAQQLEFPPQRIYVPVSMDLSQDDRRIVSASLLGEITLWTLDRHGFFRVTQKLQTSTTFRFPMKFSPDGYRIACCSPGGVIMVWEADQQGVYKLAQRLNGDKLLLNFFRPEHSKAISVDFSPDGQQLVSSSDERTITLWDAYQHGKFKRGQSLEKQEAYHSVAFSRNGRQVASYSNDTLVLLQKDGKGIFGRAFSHIAGGRILAVVFSPDGMWFANRCFPPGEIEIWKWTGRIE
jgi:hypothetical protein